MQIKKAQLQEMILAELLILRELDKKKVTSCDMNVEKVEISGVCRYWRTTRTLYLSYFLMGRRSVIRSELMGEKHTTIYL